MSDDGQILTLVPKHDKPTHPDVIVALEECLARAREMGIVAVAVSMADANGKTSYTRFEIAGNPGLLIGATSYLLHRLNSWWGEH